MLMSEMAPLARNKSKVPDATRPAIPKLFSCVKFTTRNGLPGQACYNLERLPEDGEVTEPSAKRPKTERAKCPFFPCVAVGTPRSAELERNFNADPVVAAWQRQRAGVDGLAGTSSMRLD